MQKANGTFPSKMNEKQCEIPKFIYLHILNKWKIIKQIDVQPIDFQQFDAIVCISDLRWMLRDVWLAVLLILSTMPLLLLLLSLLF